MEMTLPHCVCVQALHSLYAPALQFCGQRGMQSHASYSQCGLGSEGTDRIVALVRTAAAASAAAGEEPALYGAKITGGGSGGALPLPDASWLPVSHTSMWYLQVVHLQVASMAA